MTTAQSCTTSLDLELDVGTYYLAIRYSDERRVTELYATGWQIVRYDVDSILQVSVDTIPIAGGTWVAQDLDIDGQPELVLQFFDRLIIYSSPDWVERASFTFPGMDVVMYAVAVNLDDDPYLELFATPNNLGGFARAVVIDYDSGSDTFFVAADIPAPIGTVGHPAVGDFDNDSRVEFIAGNDAGYALFEWVDSGLCYVGSVGGPGLGNSIHAKAVRPGPCGELCALLGHSSPVTGVYRYELIKAVGDNAFEFVHVFAESTGFTGIHPSDGADSDCDGVDELVMFFPPYRRVWDWDNAAGQFVLECDNVGDGPGTFAQWYPVDLDRNGAAEWGATTSSEQLQVWNQRPCAGCDGAGHCSPPAACGCMCHGDPACDGIRADVRDVVATIDIAFRGGPPSSDPAPCCPTPPSDIDCDLVTTVLDVVRMVDVAFRGADPISTVCRPCT